MSENCALDLSVVVPAFNEAGRVEQTIARWIDALPRLGVSFEILVVDDGSTDATGQMVDAMTGAHPALRVIHQANRGHGPAVVAGYRAARGCWVFQVDADDEVGPGPFPLFWQERGQWDLLLGVRQSRRQRLPRAMVSWSLRRMVGLLVGRVLRDANAPYRLHRRDVLDALLPGVPEGAFAPNTIVSALAVARGLRVGERPVPLTGGRESGSLGGLRLLGVACRSLGELVAALGAERRRAQGPRTR